MVIRTIVHFEIPAADPSRLADFYGRVFGWEFARAEMPGMEYWLISTGPRGKSVGGGMYRKMAAEDRPRNFVLVDRIDPAIQTFKEAGGTEVTGKMEVPNMGWSFIGADPEGNLVALWEAKMPPPAPPRSRPRRRAARRAARARPARRGRRKR